MDLQHIKQIIKKVDLVEGSAVGAKHSILTEAVDLIEQSTKLMGRLADPAEQRRISFDNWTGLLKLEMEMAQFIRKLRV